MPQKTQFQTENKQRQLTLGDLLSAIALFMPAAALVGEIRATGGGVPRYVLGLPLALVLGVLVVLLEWYSGRFFWRRSQGYCGRVQKIVAIALFALQVVWIVLACIFGYRLTHLVIKFFA